MADGNTYPQLAARTFDIKQIAHALRLTRRATDLRATREAWAYTEQTVRGGRRRQYALSGLPDEVQRAVRHADAVAAANSIKSAASFQEGERLGRRLSVVTDIDQVIKTRGREAGMAKAAGLSGAARQRMEARLDILVRLDEFKKRMGLGICAAREAFCAAYAAGDVALTPEVREAVGDGLSPMSLHRWANLVESEGPAALAGAYGNRAGCGTIDSNETLREFVLGLIAAKPHIGGKILHQAIEARFADAGFELPVLRSVQRYLRDWKASNHELFTAIANPDRWKNQYKTAQGNRSADELASGLNDRWEFDSTPSDVMLSDGRHTIIGVIDVWSRQLMLYVAKTSSSTAVCQALRRAVMKWGVLKAAKLDNGQDYVSHRVQRAFRGLGVNVELSAPFSPWEKPHIERAFNTFSHGLLTLLPGYCGHNVEMAQELRARESFADRLTKKNAVVPINMDSKSLQEFCDRWCRDHYQHEVHGSLRGESPFERAASWRGEVTRIEDVRALDLLLAEAPDGKGCRTVTKKGLRVDGFHYAAPELATLVKQPVQVLYDPEDMGRVVVYHDEQFVCVAECPELLGESRVEVAALAKARQQQAMTEGRRAMKSMRTKARVGDIVNEILDHRARTAATLVALPAPNVVHLTPGLAQAGAAAAALDASDLPWEERPATANDIANVQQLVRSEQRQDDSAEGMFRRAIKLLAVDEKARAETDRFWLRSYMTSADYRGRFDMFDAFGGEAFGLGTTFDYLRPSAHAQQEYH